MTDDKPAFYKIIAYPFTAQDARMVLLYLNAFDKDRTVEMEKI